MSNGKEKVYTEVCKEHSGISTAMNNFIRWQEAQNGSLSDLRKDVGVLKYWIMGTMASALLSFLGTIILLLSKK